MVEASSECIAFTDSCVSLLKAVDYFGPRVVLRIKQERVMLEHDSYQGCLHHA